MTYQGDHPCRKFKYASEIEAQSAIITMFFRGKLHHVDLDDLRPYHCPFCQVWHVGHKSKYEQSARYKGEG